MLEKIKQFYETEYKDTIRYINSPYLRTCKKEVVNNTVQRILGVAQFIQIACNIPFEDIETLYEEYRCKLEDLKK